MQTLFHLLCSLPGSPLLGTRLRTCLPGSEITCHSCQAWGLQAVLGGHLGLVLGGRSSAPSVDTQWV